MNLKATLKKLHKKFPTMTIDELFDIVDCYEEEIHIANPYKNYTVEPFSLKDWTVTCTYPYPKDSAANQISKLNGGITYDNNSNHTSRSSTRQFESNC